MAIPQHGEPFGRGGSVNELLIEEVVLPLGCGGTSTPRPDGLILEGEAAIESLPTLTLSRGALALLLQILVLVIVLVLVLMLLLAEGAATESLHTLTLSREAMLVMS